MNVFKKVAVVLSAIGGGLMFSGSAFAVAPTPDAAVVNATTDAITGLQSGLLANLATLIPIAAVLLITVAIVFFVIRHFRAIVHA